MKAKLHTNYFLTTNNSGKMPVLNPRCSWHRFVADCNNSIGMTRVHAWDNHKVGKCPNLNPSFDDEMFNILRWSRHE